MTDLNVVYDRQHHHNQTMAKVINDKLNSSSGVGPFLFQPCFVEKFKKKFNLGQHIMTFVLQ